MIEKNAGIVLGPVSGLVNPDDMLGPLFLPFISFFVAIILFEGGLTLKFRDLFGLEAVVRNLVTIGMVATWLTTAWGTRLVTGLTHAELASQLALGGQIKATSITKAFSLEKLLSFHKGKVSLK